MKKILKNEVFSYLFFGVLTTLVYFVTRFLIFYLTQESLFAALVANITAILFAFVTNDRFVFNQPRQGWMKRLVKFVIARLSTLGIDLLLTFLLTKAFPEIIGQFVNHDPKQIDLVVSLISQVFFIILNYILSKLLVFKDKQSISSK
ncbi:GtrA family protein [Streptococcus merionis]|uniref:GtrA-like membrane protein n=1 Tax=Streptococcus merionis TaxID=400065 RepID=A0A239SLG1_9STRE|nr:GtrA family protein [Streptococcus merionis]SNU86251.1 GtrA-like membrane protein [Streptococcus merionis]